MLSNQRPWVIRQDRGLQIFNGEGKRVEFAYKKVEELLFALATANNKSLNREALAVRLWPEACLDTAKQNLRQCLYQLRKAVGEEAVQSSRTECSLTSGFPVLVDPSAILPNPVPDSSKAQTGPIAAFCVALRWLAEDNPLQMFEMMRVSTDLVSGLYPDELAPILSVAISKLPVNHRLVGWSHVLRGFAGPNARLAEYQAHALQRGIETNDHSLISFSSLCLGGNLEVHGRIREALSLADKSLSLLGPRPAPQDLKRIESFRGSTLIRLGRWREGLDLLESLTRHPNLSSLEMAYDEAARAFYLASLGRCEEASKVLEFPLKIAKSTNHFYLRLMSGLALGQIGAFRDPANAITLLDNLEKESAGRMFALYDVQLLETLAEAHRLAGNLPESAETFNRSRSIRVRKGYEMTAWDHTRIKRLRLGQAAMVS